MSFARTISIGRVSAQCHASDVRQTVVWSKVSTTYIAGDERPETTRKGTLI